MNSPLPTENNRVELPRLLRFAGLALVVLVAFSFAFVPLRSSQDEWWHLKAGLWIMQNQNLPENDIFTYTGENMRWYNHEWLSQVLFYGAYSAGEESEPDGIRRIILFKSIIVALTFGLLVVACRVYGATWAFAILVAVVAAEISRRTTYPRPPVFSYLLLTSFLAVLYGWKRHKGPAWQWGLLLLIPATVVWGNLHGMVLLAIVAVGSFAAGEVLEWGAASMRKHRSPDVPAPKKRLKTIVMLGVLTAAVIVAAMAQPSGYHLFFLGRNFTADPLLKETIAEMKPPPFFLQPTGDSSRVFVPGFATFWFSIPAILILLALNRGRFRYGADYVLVFFFLYQAVNHWRLLPLFGIAAAPAAAGLLTSLAARFAPCMRLALQYAALALALVLGSVYVFIIDEHGTFFQRNRQLARGISYNHVDYPKPLIDYLLTIRPAGRLLSETNYCGYFMWRLSPEHYKLFTDNRFDLFGSRFHRLERIMFAAKQPGDPDELTGEPLAKGWKELMAEYGINLVVLHRAQPLHRALLQEPDWRDIYYYLPLAAPGRRNAPYDGWSVWVRSTPESQPVIERAEAWWRRHGSGPTPAQLDALLVPASQQSASTEQNPVGSEEWRVPIQR